MAPPRFDDDEIKAHAQLELHGAGFDATSPTPGAGLLVANRHARARAKCVRAARAARTVSHRDGSESLELPYLSDALLNERAAYALGKERARELMEDEGEPESEPGPEEDALQREYDEEFTEADVEHFASQFADEVTMAGFFRLYVKHSHRNRLLEVLSELCGVSQRAVVRRIGETARTTVLVTRARVYRWLREDALDWLSDETARAYCYGARPTGVTVRRLTDEDEAWMLTFDLLVDWRAPSSNDTQGG
jgi:hypothetical protein